MTHTPQDLPVINLVPQSPRWFYSGLARATGREALRLALCLQACGSTPLFPQAQDPSRGQAKPRTGPSEPSLLPAASSCWGRFGVCLLSQSQQRILPRHPAPSLRDPHPWALSPWLPLARVLVPWRLLLLLLGAVKAQLSRLELGPALLLATIAWKSQSPHLGRASALFLLGRPTRGVCLSTARTPRAGRGWCCTCAAPTLTHPGPGLYSLASTLSLPCWGLPPGLLGGQP